MTNVTGETAPRKAAAGIKRVLWLLCAAIFLTEAWLWDHIGELLRSIYDFIPLAALKQELARQLEKLPPILALLVLAVPVSLMEACKAFGVWMAARGYPVFGILIFVLSNALGVGAAAFLFEATRHKLLSIWWFERFYNLVLDLRAKAEAVIKPYKDQIRASIEPVRRQLKEHLRLSTSPSDFVRRLSLLRRWARRGYQN